MIDAEPAVIQEASDAVPGLRGEVRFAELCFAYTPDEQILNKFKLHLRAGENLALVGHTGAGKSSIAKLIARFYEYQDGNILIDEVNGSLTVHGRYHIRGGCDQGTPEFFGFV